MDAIDHRIHEHRGGLGAEATGSKCLDGLAHWAALRPEGFGEQADFSGPAQEAGCENRERITAEAVEFTVGIDEAFGRPHIGSLRGLRQAIRSEQGLVAFPFELERIGASLHQPVAFADRPDGSADSGGGLDHLHLRTGTGHGVGDGQSGWSGSEYDCVEHHGSIIKGER